MKFQNQGITLHSGAVPEDTLVVAKMRGEERMSGLFRFELDLICKDVELDLEAVLYAPVTLGLKVAINLGGASLGSTKREITGVFEVFEQLEGSKAGARYRAVLVPKLWQTMRAHRSRIFLDKTIEDLVTDVLKGDGFDATLDFEFKLSRPGSEGDAETRAVYPLREYVVQYEESDWQFLARWLEHEGIFFYFTNEDGNEKVVFADDRAAYAAAMFGSTFPYRPETSEDGADSGELTGEEVRSFHCRQTRLPKKVTVNDYNWRVPSARLNFSEDVLENGTGLQTEYNDHFKNEAQGKALAKLRVEELACRSKVFHGTGNCRSFRPGSRFTLEDHFREGYNRAYLLVSVQHEAEQMVSMESAKITGVRYQNTFEAICDDQEWRPERVTDWPSIKGVMNATVDSSGDGKYADLDPYGRYKLRMPFDEYSDDAPAGGASRWVRMSQPYAGVRSGMHFPLLKGTEVLLTHIDGDPDRPVISGAVPNMETESPTTGTNNTMNGFTTASGNVMQIDDNENSQGFLTMDSTASYVSDQRRHLGPGHRKASSGSTPASGTGGAANGECSSRGETPSSGSGMTKDTTSKEAGWNQGADTKVGPTGASVNVTGASAAWLKFVGGDAVKDIAKTGKFQGADKKGAKGLGFSDWKDPSHNWGEIEAVSYSGIGQQTGGSLWTDAVDDPNTADVDESKTERGSAGTGLRAILVSLADLSRKLASGDQVDNAEWKPVDFGDGDSEGLTPAGIKAADLTGVFDKIHNFTGEAYGSRLRTWVGDDLFIKLGDKYTYNDVTRDISIGTGGLGWKEEHGDTEDHSFHWGDATSYSHHHGDDTSTTYRHGTQTSSSYSYSAFKGHSVSMDAHASFALTGSAHATLGIDLGAYVENSIFLGAKGGLNLFVGLPVDIDIYAALGIKIELSASSKIGINLCADNLKLTAKNTELVLKSDAATLNKTMAKLQGMSATVDEKSNVLLGMQNRIKYSIKSLSDDRVTLSNSFTALSDSITAANSSNTGASTTFNAMALKLSAIALSF